MFYVLFLAQEKLCREDIATKAMACFSKDDTIHISGRSIGNAVQAGLPNHSALQTP